MGRSNAESSCDEPLIERIAQEILERRRKGEKPTVEEYCERHPDQAEELRSFLPALLAVESLKPDSQDASGPLDSEIEVGGQRRSVIGDYRILREIGRGGMGVVYEAEQQALGRHVALKVVSRQSAGNGKAIERFQTEARAAARMHHTNIVPVFDVGQDDDYLYYAMQLIQGQSLDLVIDDLEQIRANSLDKAKSSLKNGQSNASNSPQSRSIALSLVSGDFQQEQFAKPGGDSSSSGMSQSVAATQIMGYNPESAGSAVLPGQSDISTADQNRRAYYLSVASIGHQTASALAYAHARGIIHRDIKPSNLVLDNSGIVWITDFGLAKTGDQGLTHTGDILGTLRYMSPERFRGQCDVRADVYSLGLSLYELLTLKPAFESPDRLKMIEMINNSEPESLRAKDPRIPRDLETIILKAIDKDPKRRYQSADDMEEDLQRFLDDEPIKARRISSAEQLFRWGRRNKGLAAALSIVAALLLIIAVGSSFAAGHFRNLVTATEAARQEAEETSNENAQLAQDKEEEAKKAKAAEEEARKQREEADALAAEQLVRQAAVELENGDLATAALLIAEAIKRLRGDPEREANLRRMFASIIKQSPQPTRILFHNGEVVRDARYSENGKWIVTAAGKTVRIWEAGTGNLVKSKPHEGEVSQTAFRFNDSKVFSIVTDYKAGKTYWHLWDWRADASTTIPHVYDDNRSIHIGSNSLGQLVAVTGDNELSIYSLKTGRRTGEPRSISGKSNSLVWRHSGAAGKQFFVYWSSKIDETAPVADPSLVERVASSPALKELMIPSFVTLGLWDLKEDKHYSLMEGVRVPEIRIARSRTSYSTALSPDGRLFACEVFGEFNEWELALFDTATGKRVDAFSPALPRLSPIQFSPDGRHLLCGQSDSPTNRKATRYLLLDAKTGEQRGNAIPTKVDSPVKASYSPDGRGIAALDSQGQLQVFDGEDGSPITPPLAQSAGVSRFVWNPDSRWICGTTRDGGIRLWDGLTGRRVGSVLKQRSEVTDIEFSRDGSELLIAGGHQVRIWPVSPPEVHAVRIRATAGRGFGNVGFGFRAPPAGIIGPGFEPIMSADGTRIATARFRPGELTITIWDAATGERLYEREGFPLTFRQPGGMEFGPENRSLLVYQSARDAVNTFNGRNRQPAESGCRVWHFEENKLVSLPMTERAESVNAGFASQDEVWTTWTETDADGEPEHRTARLWNAGTGKPLGPQVVHQRWPRPIATQNDAVSLLFRLDRSVLFPAKALLAGRPLDNNANEVRIWNLRTGRVQATISFGDESLEPWEFHAEGTRLSIVSIKDDQRRIRCVDAADGKLIGGPVEEPARGTYRLTISPDGRRIAFQPRRNNAVISRLVEIVDLRTGERRELSHDQAVSSFVFDSEGRRLLTNSADEHLRLWNAETGELQRMMKRMNLDTEARGEILEFSRDNQRIVYSLGPRTQEQASGFQIWDAVTGQEIANIPSARLVSQAWSDQADRFLIREQDGLLVEDLSPETRPLDEILKIAEALSGRKLDPRGNLQSLASDEFALLWPKIEGEIRKRFLPPVTGEEWHRRNLGRRSGSGNVDVSPQLWHLDRLLESNPNDVSLNYQKARLSWRSNQGDQALEHADRVLALIEKNGGDTDATVSLSAIHTLKAQIFQSQNKWREAAQEFERAYEEDPERFERVLLPFNHPLQSAALAWHMAGNTAKYEAVCKTFVNLLMDGQADPQSAEFLLIVPRPIELLDALWLVAEPAAARNTGRVGFGPFQQQSNILAWIEFRSEKYEKAKEMLLSDGTAIGADDLLILSMCQYQLGKKQEAQATFDRALARSRQDDDSRTALGQRFNIGFAATGPTVITEILRKEAEEMLKGAKLDSQK